jgi:hypothetical protein
MMENDWPGGRCQYCGADEGRCYTDCPAVVTEQELAECKAQYDDCDKLVSAQRAEIKRLRGAIEYAIFYLEEFVESDAADKLRLVLKETKMMSEWQPIETAPKDGSAILTCYAPQYDTNGFLPVAIRWRTYHPNAAGKPAWRTSNGTKIEAVTHWMHLPEPPAQE